MIDYLAIGHITEDVWQDGRTPGGTVMYSSRAARAFVDHVAVLTAAAPSFDMAAALPGIHVHCLDAPSTTQFENRYSAAGRTQYVAPCPVRLMARDLTSDMRASAIVHLGPVCDEISADVVAHVRPETFVGITPQGWMRRWDGAGRVTSCAGYWTDAATILARANAAVTSIDDIAGDWDVARRWAAQTSLLVVTQGAGGCTAFLNGRPTHVPAPQVQEVDPTGAGDIFAAVLFIAQQRGDAPLHACAYANCIAAQSVTRPHLAGLPTPRDMVLCRPEQ
jgi:hypothetical protein